MNRYLGHALGSFVAPIIEYVDVNGVVQRIDLDDAIQRIDINALLDRVDVDRLLSRIDLNEQIQRLDWNSIANRIDFDYIVQRSNLEAIVARSTSSIFSSVWDKLRTTVVRVDQQIQSIGTCTCCSEKRYLPPRPGEFWRSKKKRYPKTNSQLAIDIQGRYCGSFIRLIAFGIDSVIVWGMFALTLLLVGTLARVVTHDDDVWSLDSRALVPLSYLGFSYFYHFFSLAGASASIGKLIFGLSVVQAHDGSPITLVQALIRPLATFISLVSVVGVLRSFFRIDARTLHDCICCTGVVYCWDARMAQVRLAAREQHERFALERTRGIDDDDDEEA